MALNGLSTISGLSLDRSPDIEYIFEISIASSSVRSGSIVAKDFASSVFPDHGGPSMRILCHQAAAISRARFACACQMTCAKSYPDSSFSSLREERSRIGSGV